jgi:Cys-tRNA(Pro) deacylase
MARTLGPADLAAYMQAHAIPGEIVRLEMPTPTVETAAQAAGTTPERIVKSILFLVDGQPLLAVTNGLAHVNYRVLAAHRGVNRKKVKMASAEQVLQTCGYAVGALPPFGHLQRLPCLLDRRVMAQPEVFAGGGAEDTLVRLAPADLLQATRAEILDLTAPPSQGGERG